MSAPGTIASSLVGAFFDSQPDPMLLADSAGVILATNRAASQLLGAAGSPLVGCSIGQLLPCFSRSGVSLPPTTSGRLEWRCEFVTPHRTGRLIQVTGTALHQGSDETCGWAFQLKDLDAGHDGPQFIGKSAATRQLLERMSEVAAGAAPAVLLLGEPGTGKELVAKRIHVLSRRSSAPFLPINCAAIPDYLLESELFGFEKDGFSGAQASREGLLESAQGGTVFLDEISELPLSMQGKLLRVIESRCYRRTGGTEDLPIQVYVIAATSRNIERAIARHAFREDLYRRLSSVQIQLPPLRERAEDIHEMAAYFLQRFNRIHHRQIQGLHPRTEHMLAAYSWPGNARELRNVIERAVLVEESRLLMPVSLALPGMAEHQGQPPDADPIPPSAPFSLSGNEHELILAALAKAEGNQTRAAQLLGIGRFSLRYKMKKLKML
jgi:transcriptional regulator with PAS, ATPase and Fis domain